MVKKLSLLLLVIASVGSITLLQAQTKEELGKRKAENKGYIKGLQSQVDSLKGVVAGIDKQLLEFPRWELNAFGVIGLDFNSFNDWLAREKPNTFSSTIAVTGNAAANYFTKKSFWRNSLNANFGWVKFDDKDNPDDNPDFEQTSDVINVSSLYGYKLSSKIATSALVEYRSTLLSNFNNPGYLDVGVGVTWTPINNLVVVAHPFNYNFVFSEGDFEYNSSLGAKVVADYAREIVDGVNWRSNLSVFLSYKDLENLSNWTWINGVGFNVWKGFGVGFELGLRKNMQEAMALDLADNPLQTYWVLGITYSL